MPKEMADMEAAPEIASTKILISSFQQGDHVLN
jgi:hypothetical protein